MPSQTAKLLFVLVAGALASLAGCKGNDTAPASAVTQGASDDASEVVPSSDPSGEATGSAAGIAADLDLGALQERRDPERLLRFYTNAIRVGDWGTAAKAWSLDAQITPEKLRSEFEGDAGPKIAVGKGDWENAAGTVFYEAPVTIDFPDGRDSRRGTIVLRRADDVPGASDLQLVWRIARSSVLSQ
jgi:hypothetical protein